MRKLLLLLMVVTSVAYSQDLTDVRICIDPGHSGHESDDRYMEATGFWESESNLTKGLELRDILLGLGASVAITRTGNNNTTDDLSLSQRVGVANSFNADFFNSNHSNGFNGQANYAMVIYNGTTNNPTFPLARTMANIMSPLIHDVNHTTHSVVYGDLTLNPTWTNGYGVLYPANMPATISEGSFHDYIPESWRLMNLDYRKHEARALARSYLQYFGEPGFPTGAIAGLVKDPSANVDYWSMSSLQDQYTPVNNIHVSIEPGGHIYHGGANNNGYFKVDSLSPGTYEVVVSVEGFLSDTTQVTVTPNHTVFADFMLSNSTPPIVEASTPENGDQTFPAWDIPYVDFSKRMERTSVEAAFSITPDVEGNFYFSTDRKRFAFLPADTLEFVTDYTITLAGTAHDDGGFFLDGNQDGVGGDDWTITFRTSPRDNIPPSIVSTSPENGASIMSLRPVFTFVWDEELEPNSISSDMVKLERTYNLALQESVLQHHVFDGQSVFVLFASNDLLPEENYRVRIFPGFEDLFGNTQGGGTVLNFTTPNYDYSVTSIDNFESGLTSNWWTPSGSGSTTGTLDLGTARSENNAITVVNTGSNKSMQMDYAWDTAASSWLIREYLASGPPRAVHFTSEKIMQAFIFGDANGNTFRFCVDDASGTEVSPWYTIDWYGWKLVTWDMSVDGTGTWIGDGTLNGTLEFDSMHFSHISGQPSTGVYYIDDLRVVSKDYLALGEFGQLRPTEYALQANYPNPFNPWTSIPFTLPQQAEVQINVYNLRGEQVAHLISGSLEAGQHITRWDASKFPSGVYVVEMKANDISITRKVTVLK